MMRISRWGHLECPVRKGREGCGWEGESWRVTEPLHTPSSLEGVFCIHVLRLILYPLGETAYEEQVKALDEVIIYVNMRIHTFIQWHAYEGGVHKIL